MTFTVITHNGLMPRDGGRRLGFIAGGKIFALPGVPLSWLVPPKPPAPPKPKGIVLSDLRRARGWSNRCPHCDSSDTHHEMAVLSDGGTKMLVKCESCDKFFRDCED